MLLRPPGLWVMGLVGDCARVAEDVRNSMLRNVPLHRQIAAACEDDTETRVHESESPTLAE